VEAIEMRTIYIPAIEKSVSIGQYVKAIKIAKANPDKEFKHGLTCWWPCLGRDIVSQFFDGLTDRINQSIPYVDRKGAKR
jgi:hypothetical protein